VAICLGHDRRRDIAHPRDGLYGDRDRITLAEVAAGRVGRRRFGGRRRRAGRTGPPVPAGPTARRKPEKPERQALRATRSAPPETAGFRRFADLWNQLGPTCPSLPTVLPGSPDRQLLLQYWSYARELRERRWQYLLEGIANNSLLAGIDPNRNGRPSRITLDWLFAGRHRGQTTRRQMVRLSGKEPQVSRDHTCRRMRRFDRTEARKGAPVYPGRALGFILDERYPRPVGLARLSRGSVAPRSLVAVAPAVGPGHRPA
jgi:hypothetical protein